MDRELRDLPAIGPPGGPRLGARGLDRDVDLAQEELAPAILEVSWIGEREGEHIGGPVRFQEVTVQGSDPLIAGQDEGDGGARKAQDPERAPEERLKSGRS